MLGVGSVDVAVVKPTAIKRSPRVMTVAASGETIGVMPRGTLPPAIPGLEMGCKMQDTTRYLYHLISWTSTTLVLSPCHPLSPDAEIKNRFVGSTTVC